MQAYSSCLFNLKESVLENIFWFHTSISRPICENSELRSQLTCPVNQTWPIQRQNASQHIVVSCAVVTSQIKCVWEAEKKSQAFAPNTSFPCPQLMINNEVTSSVVMWKGSKCPALEIKWPIQNSLSLFHSLIVIASLPALSFSSITVSLKSPFPPSPRFLIGFCSLKLNSLLHSWSVSFVVRA